MLYESMNFRTQNDDGEHSLVVKFSSESQPQEAARSPDFDQHHRGVECLKTGSIRADSAQRKSGVLR